MRYARNILKTEPLIEVLIPSGLVAQVCKELKPIGGEVEIAVSTEALRFTGTARGLTYPTHFSAARKDLLQLAVNFTPMVLRSRGRVHYPHVTRQGREASTHFAIKCDAECAQRFKFAFFKCDSLAHYRPYTA